MNAKPIWQLALRNFLHFAIDVTIAIIGMIYGFGLTVQNWGVVLGLMFFTRWATSTLHSALLLDDAKKQAAAQPVEVQLLATKATQDVLAERRRQMEVKGYILKYDDEHVNEELAALATFYAMPAYARNWDASIPDFGKTLGQTILPLNWKSTPGDRRGELVKAGALILAEIERLDRAAHNIKPTRESDLEGSAP